jgi:hypothetical protein
MERECPNCGSENLSPPTPFLQNVSGGVVDGRLKMNDIAIHFAVGCNDCSETIRILTAREVVIQQIEGLRKVGQEVWFEYHCNESHDSAHAEHWYRSHQRATIIEVRDGDGFRIASQEERIESGVLIGYLIRFADGFEADVFEDELLDSREEFSRPDPPERPKTTPAPA